MAAAAPGALVKLTAESWNGAGPEVGDVLETRTGRRYLILEISGRARHGQRRFACAVMAPEDPYPEGAVRFDWSWAPRSRRG